MGIVGDGRRSKEKLTKARVDAFQPREGQKLPYAVFDSEVPGFGVRIHPSGYKVFVLKYAKRGVQRWVTLGAYGILTVDAARKMAAQQRFEVLQAGRALPPARARMDGVTVRELGGRFLEEHAEVKTKPRTASEYRRIVEKIINPRLGHHLVLDVTPSDTHSLHHKLAETPRMANLVLAVVSKMFNLAEIWGYRPQQTNPCYHIQRYKENQRERFLNKRELTRLGETLAAMDEKNAEDTYILAAIRMLILTGARLREILHLRWDQVDLENGLLRLPDSKSGAKAILLSRPAFDVLRGLHPIKDNPFVFPGDRAGQPLQTIARPWMRIRALAAIEGVRIHDLRHTFASMGVQSGMTLETIGGLLGHSQVSTTKRYAHLSLDGLKAKNEAIGKRLSQAMGTEEEAKPKQRRKASSKS